MAVYEFSGRNTQGQAINGRLEAASTDAVVGQLLNRGITPVKIVEVADALPLEVRINRWLGLDKVTAQDLIMFTRQMYTITKAGIPLIRGFRGLSQTLSHYRLKRALEDVADRLETGMDLSSALRYRGDIFDNLFISMIHVGENSGRLEEVFDQLSQYLERDQATRKSVTSALRYPSFVLVALALAVAVLNIWVIPEFARMFARFGAELPLLTRVLIGVSDFFVNYWGYLLVCMVLSYYGCKRYLQTTAGKLRWGRWKLKLPVVGSIIERGTMARYARSFSLMLKSGVPLTQSLELCSRAIDNPYLGGKIQHIRQGVERGESLLRTHTHSDMFTPLILQMIAVGEESGQVETLLSEVAEFYEREVEYELKSLGQKIEPLIIVLMAGFVLVMALGIFLPMWEMYNVQQS